MYTPKNALLYQMNLKFAKGLSVLYLMSLVNNCCLV